MSSNLFKITVIQSWVHDTWIGLDGQPCPKGTPGARFVKARKVKARTPGAKKVKKKSKKWYGRVPGSKQPVPLSSNKVAAQQMLAQLVTKAEMAKVGIKDSFEKHRTQPLVDPLADFEADLQAKGNTPKQVKLKIGRIRRLLEGCRFVFMDDLSPSGVQQYLADLREGNAATDWN
jgi:hypothetical protein